MSQVILLTRPARDGTRLASELRDRLGDIPVVLSPVLRISPTGHLPDPRQTDGLIVTSRNTVAVLADAGFPPRPAYCVGAATAHAAQEAGHSVIAQAPDGAALATRITADRPGGHWVHAGGTHLRVDIAQVMKNAGLSAEHVAIYEQSPEPLSAQAKSLLAGHAPVILPLYSPRSAEILAKTGEIAAPLYIVALSPAVAGAMTAGPGTKCVIARHPDNGSMLDAIVSAYQDAARVEGDKGGK